MNILAKYKESENLISASMPSSQTTQIATLQNIISEQSVAIATQRVTIEQYKQLSEGRGSLHRAALASLDEAAKTIESLEDTIYTLGNKLNAKEAAAAQETNASADFNSLLNSLILGYGASVEVQNKIAALPFDFNALVRFATRAQLSSFNAKKLGDYLKQKGADDISLRVGNMTNMERATTFRKIVAIVFKDLDLCQIK